MGKVCEGVAFVKKAAFADIVELARTQITAEAS